jgi:hypothetical protein
LTEPKLYPHQLEAKVPTSPLTTQVQGEVVMWVTIFLIFFLVFMGIMIFLAQRHDEKMEAIKHHDGCRIDASPAPGEEQAPKREHP